MIKLFKHLKPFAIFIIIIIGLLFVQAMCTLALPEYMSDIVNTGIGQGGIETSVPRVIRKSEFEKIQFFLNDEDRDFVKSHYKLLDRNELSSELYNNYVLKYPLLKKEALYELKDVSEKDLEELNLKMGKAILILYWITNDNIKTLDIDMPFVEGHDPFLIISNMSQDDLEQARNIIESKIEKVPDNLVIQSSVIYIKDELKLIGVNTDDVQRDYILQTGLKMVGVAFLAMVVSVFVNFIASRVSAGLGRNMRKSIFSKIQTFSNIEFDKWGVASLITRTTNDTMIVQHMMIMILRVVFYAPIIGIGGAIKVLSTTSSMGWIIVLALSLIFIVLIFLFFVAVPKFKLVQKLIDKLNLVTRESLTGMLVIRAFNNEKHEEARFNKANQDLTKNSLFTKRVMATMFPLLMLIMNIISVLIVWVGSYKVDAGLIQVGDMMAFIQYTMQIIMAFLMISITSIMLPRAMVAAGRIDEVLSVEPSILDSDNPKVFTDDFKGNIKFKNVSFKYPGAEKYVIKNISFEAKAGETTAFIGSTGSGKSTIINLIPRFYDITEGIITIDGVDIKDVRQYELRNRIGYVPQKGILFSGTIESNLKYGKEDASVDDMKEAAKIAQAYNFIMKKDKKFEEEIAQGGTNVSGGQKQRLSIARALIKKPNIYIFDDTFSALDFKTDASLRKALSKVTEESTVLIVAQRINTIMNADQIIVLNDGKIVGKGKHEELLETCKIYKEIAISQLPKEGAL